MVAAEQGMSIAPASMRQSALADVAYRTIDDASLVAKLALVQRKSSRSDLVGNFDRQARGNTAKPDHPGDAASAKA